MRTERNFGSVNGVATKIINLWFSAFTLTHTWLLKLPVI